MVDRPRREIRGGAVLAPFEGGGIIAVIIIGFVMSPRPSGLIRLARSQDDG